MEDQNLSEIEKLEQLRREAGEDSVVGKALKVIAKVIGDYQEAVKSLKAISG